MEPIEVFVEQFPELMDRPTNAKKDSGPWLPCCSYHYSPDWQTVVLIGTVFGGFLVIYGAVMTGLAYLYEPKLGQSYSDYLGFNTKIAGLSLLCIGGLFFFIGAALAWRGLFKKKGEKIQGPIVPVSIVDRSNPHSS